MVKLYIYLVLVDSSAAIERVVRIKEQCIVAAELYMILSYIMYYVYFGKIINFAPYKCLKHRIRFLKMPLHTMLHFVREYKLRSANLCI